MAHRSNRINTDSAHMKWFTPRVRKITGATLGVVAVAMAIFAILLAANVFGCSIALHYSAAALVTGAILPAGAAAYLLKPKKSSHFQRFSVKHLRD